MNIDEAVKYCEKKLRWYFRDYDVLRKFVRRKIDEKIVLELDREDSEPEGDCEILERVEDLFREARARRLRGLERELFIMDGLKPFFACDEDLFAFVMDQTDRLVRNLYGRRKRLKRKANTSVRFLVDYDIFFYTQTYDDDKHTEESFKKCIDKCMSNRTDCARGGWRYIKNYERGDEGDRLHIHAVLFIPKSEHFAERLTEVREYSTKRRCMCSRMAYPEFDKKFGHSDFEYVTPDEFMRGKVINYLVKHAYKSEFEVVYSRHLPTEFIALVDLSELFFYVEKKGADCVFDSVNLLERYQSYRDRHDRRT
jgi:hypothetical protein